MVAGQLYMTLTRMKKRIGVLEQAGLIMSRN
jgi:hypothetical protein